MEKLKLLLLTVLFIGFSINTWSQTKQVTGVVVDEKGMPLPGANVVVKGTSKGVVTDFDGNFIISADNAKNVLVISFIGFINKEVALNGSKNYKITLSSDAKGLQEVVVIGYGSVKKSDLTGAVSSLSSANITKQKKTDLGQALQGKVAGVDVRALSNKPGAPLSIDIRGNTVIKQDNLATKDGLSDSVDDDLSKPLYVVDGIFFENINALNPADIQQMDILKDASATAIYGARGANGVVIITTKNGIEGKTVFTYETTVGLRSATNIPEFFNGDQYVNFVGDVLRSTAWKGLSNLTTGVYATAADYNNLSVNIYATEIKSSNEEASNVANRRYTDWGKDYRHTGLQNSHNLGMSGGTNGLVYNASLGYLSDEGVMGIEGYKRYNVGLSLSKKVSDQFTLGVKTYLALSEREEGSRELFRSSLRLAPTVNSIDPAGNYIITPDDQDSRFVNPYFDANGAWRVNTKSLDVIANIFLNYKAADWVTFKTQFSPNINNKRFGEYRGLLTKSAENNPAKIRALYQSYFNTAYTWDNIADFNFNIAKDHNLKATLISSIYYNQKENSKIENRNFDTDAYLFYNTESGSEKIENSSEYYKETLSSFAGRLNYSIKDRYLFTFTGRYDGSSKLAVDNKWAFFPSAAFAWKVSDESFLKDSNWLSNLKLRLSYGESGNDSSVKAYSSLAFLKDADYLSNAALVNGTVVSGLPNTNLSWERSKEFNVGFDLAILKNRVKLSLELYNKKTVDGVFDRTLSAISGYDSALGNFASVRNKGVEITLNTTNVKLENFKWSTDFNFSKNKNQILKLDGDRNEEIYGTHGILRIGEAIDAIYAYEKIGIWQIAEAAQAAVYKRYPGEYKFKDQDNNGVIDSNDKVILGQVSPKWIAGMTNTFDYKNFDFSVQVYTRQGSYGHSEFNSLSVPYNGDDAKINKLNLDYWTPNNPNSKYPALEYGADVDWYYTSFDFVKIGNIGLGYEFTKPMLDKLNMSSLRLSVDVQNPFTFTNYTGPDPETGLQNSYNGGYMVKTVLFGLKLSY